jgi:hypothetical protein
MRRRRCIGALLVAACSPAAWGQPAPAEQQRIDRLIDAVGQHKDLRFLRNGREYTAAQAADFLRGKLKWRVEKVKTMQDFIDEVGTRSTTSGDPYFVRLADGRVLPSAEFLREELRRIEKKR